MTTMSEAEQAIQLGDVRHRLLNALGYGLDQARPIQELANELGLELAEAMRTLFALRDQGYPVKSTPDGRCYHLDYRRAPGPQVVRYKLEGEEAERYRPDRPNAEDVRAGLAAGLRPWQIAERFAVPSERVWRVIREHGLMGGPSAAERRKKPNRQRSTAGRDDDGVPPAEREATRAAAEAAAAAVDRVARESAAAIAARNEFEPAEGPEEGAEIEMPRRKQQDEAAPAVAPAAAAEGAGQEPQRRKRGRPKGSKTRKRRATAPRVGRPRRGRKPATDPGIEVRIDAPMAAFRVTGPCAATEARDWLQRAITFLEGAEQQVQLQLLVERTA